MKTIRVQLPDDLHTELRVAVARTPNSDNESIVTAALRSYLAQKQAKVEPRPIAKASDTKTGTVQTRS